MRPLRNRYYCCMLHLQLQQSLDSPVGPPETERPCVCTYVRRSTYAPVLVTETRIKPNREGVLFFLSWGGSHTCETRSISHLAES